MDLLRTIMRRLPAVSDQIEVHNPNAQDRPELEFSTIACIDTGNQNIMQVDDLRAKVDFYLRYLSSRGFIHIGNSLQGWSAVRILPDGIIFIEKHQAKVTLSQQAFVAMWFGAEMTPIWQDGIDPGVRSAGYSPFRIDQHTHENRIDDEIISQIRQSRFLISDFTTGHVETAGGGTHLVPRGGVYFEAGFALGLGIPVIWTIRENQIGGLHFDTRQYPHILWSNAADLQIKLRDRIIALIGRGPIATA